MEALLIIFIILISLLGILLLASLFNILMKHVDAKHYCAAHNDTTYAYLRVGQPIPENEKYWLHVHFPGRICKEPFAETVPSMETIK